MIQSTPGVRRHAEKWLRMLRTAATIIFSALWVVLPARADPQQALPLAEVEPRPALTTLEHFDSMLEQRSESEWLIRENGNGPEFSVFGRSWLDYAEQYFFTPEADAALKALRAKAGAQAASGDQAGLADTLRQAQAIRDLDDLRMGILYAFAMLSTGIDVHEAALEVFLGKSPAAEQQKTRARLDPMLDATLRRLTDLLQAPTVEEAKRGIELEPVSLLPNAYNEERMRLAPFAAEWDKGHGIAPMSRVRSTPCSPPHPDPSTTGSPSLDKSTMTQPEYPVDARRLHFAGTIQIRAEISETGCAQRVEIARSAGFQSLDEAALAWAEGLRFHPAQADGRPKAGSYTFAVTFRLND
jgi:TonB family protein